MATATSDATTATAITQPSTPPAGAVVTASVVAAAEEEAGDVAAWVVPVGATVT